MLARTLVAVLVTAASAALITIHVAAMAAQPLPSGDSLSKAKRAVYETYRRDMASDEGQRKMLADADKMGDDATSQAAIYVVLTERGSPRVAFDALDCLGKRFDFDALAGKVAYVEAATKHAKKPDDRLSAFNRAIEALEESIDNDRLKLAERCLKAATSARVKDPELRKELAERRKQLEKLKHDHEAQDKALADAKRALDKNPNDAVANECVGRHMAVRGDWSHALKHLAKADVRDVRVAAVAELSGAMDTAKQLAIGDVWWNAAEAAEKPERQAYQAHAVYWYTLAAPSLTGLAKTRAEKRIAEAGAVDIAGQATVGERFADVVLGPGVTMRLVKIPASADGKVKSFWLGQTEVTRAQWKSVMQTDPSSQTRSEHLPVTNVSLADAKEACAKLNSLGTRFSFRLPSKDEWFAACGPCDTASLTGVAWTRENAGGSFDFHDVATKSPTKNGLHDMIGNALEWLADGSAAGISSFDSIDSAAARINNRGVISSPDKNVIGTAGVRIAADLR